MTIIEALIIALVQGITEFLPVSSSGHIVIFQYLLNVEEPPLTFGIIVHLGTLIAVFVAFWQDIISILKKPFSRITLLIIIGSIPAALVGFFLEPLIEKAFTSLLVVGIGLIFTGFILKYSEKLSNLKLGLKLEEKTSIKDIIVIGSFQALAIIPGISRSGATIAAGLISGLDREFAARLSFLLSIPVILGAAVFQLSDVFASGIYIKNLLPYGIGLICSALFGYLAIKVVVNLVKFGRLSVFAYYVWGVGFFTLVAYFLF
ncbi:Undecaprenyl-diphosphatase [Candidatus Syntrophocurvum alkaliphilum]|uniref:Undecaprenyl-diphosphatase n=1 Tax=Candidatus Syntrophocurvum alkaliphilum TaxID=2293317 RepID=A0A6I6DH09_9FIRM|nr:undecaprenyl-diphosphate phosphatase [Candidatus Syntrophocurvum alkaliphilum]QGT99650.1 Undecaprenyl-diphosphatase [Candidatus Syntrophocurvum alkaliphilum]